jgi:hypothetical protein
MEASKNKDMIEIAVAESRVPEIAFVNPAKAPELMSVFSSACFALGRQVSKLHYEHRLAKKKLGDRAAVMLIDIIPDQMTAKSLRDNEQNRQAFLDLDPEYSAAWLAEAQAEALLMLTERKLRDMEGALNAVKEASRGQHGIAYRQNPNLQTGGFDLDAALEQGQRDLDAVRTASANGVRMPIGKATF